MPGSIKGAICLNEGVFCWSEDQAKFISNESADDIGQFIPDPVPLEVESMEKFPMSRSSGLEDESDNELIDTFYFKSKKRRIL